MAWIEARRSGTYHVCFRFQGHRFKRSLHTSDNVEADAALAKLKLNMRLVEMGRLDIPDDADVATFLLSDGKVNSNGKSAESNAKQSRQVKYLTELFDAFFKSIPDGSLENTTLDGMKIHQRHIIKAFGARFLVQNLDLEDLQSYVNTRARQKTNRNKTISATTISKELTTFTTVWRWGARTGRVSGEFPRDGIRLPKTEEQPPFQTWDEIERQIEQDGLDVDAAKDLWDCLYLRRKEIDALLLDVEQKAAYGFVHPMFVMAAHTGARRSELLRSRKSDFEFKSDHVTIRERKRVRGKLTTRRVSLSPYLTQVMQNWFNEDNPGGPYSFCHPGSMPRSNRKAREPLTKGQARKHFTNTLKNTKWEKMKGWHCLRHSFISNLACKGIDQRIIDEFVGHTTEQMRRRYRHLFPDLKKAAIDQVFG